jgi:ribosomal protein L37AE/L43A
MLELKVTEQKYTCTHCNSKFTKEKTLIVHMCEQKRRHLAKGEKHVQVAYQAYVRFYLISQKQDKIKTYDEFAHSPYYNAFVKFGSFVSNVNPLYPDKYIDYVVTSGVRLDHWCRDGLYEEYVLHLVKTENVETALERSIKHMTDWAETSNSVWNHYFNYVSTNRAVYDVKDGKISPWLLLNSVSGKKLLGGFNDEQLTAVGSIIDPVFWKKKFHNQFDDVELVKQVAKEANL